MDARRRASLRENLELKRLELSGQVQQARNGVQTNEGERFSEDEPRHEDMIVTLLAIRAENLQKIVDALIRLDKGVYGHCCDCGGEISEARLRALPFAVRCKDCEEIYESVRKQTAARANNNGRIDLSLFP